MNSNVIVVIAVTLFFLGIMLGALLSQEHPFNAKPLPACWHKDVLYETMVKPLRYRLSWSGKFREQDETLAMFVNDKEGAWFLVAMKIDSIRACILARGDKSRLWFGRSM